MSLGIVLKFNAISKIFISLLVISFKNNNNKAEEH